MADTKISALTAADTLVGTEVLPVVQAGATTKATVTQVVAAGSGTYDALGAAAAAQAHAIQRANHTGSQAISTVTGLQTALDGKVASAGGLLISHGGVSSTVVSTTTETDVLSVALPTDMAVGTRLILHAGLDILNTSGTQTSRWRLYLDDTLIGDTVAYNNGANASRRPAMLDATMAVLAVSGPPSQWFTGQFLSGATLVGGSDVSMVISSSSNVGVISSPAAEDLSSAKNLRITITLGASLSTLEARRTSYALWRYNPA